MTAPAPVAYPAWDGADDFDGPEDFNAAWDIAEQTNEQVAADRSRTGVPA